jgi:hypothetical protein
LTKPKLGDDVYYRGKHGYQAMRAAKVTATIDSLDPRGVETGAVPALTDDSHAHLWVFTPGGSDGFAEYNVPCGEGAVSEVEEIPPGTWCWPPASD